MGPSKQGRELNPEPNIPYATGCGHFQMFHYLGKDNIHFLTFHEPRICKHLLPEVSLVLPTAMCMLQMGQKSMVLFLLTRQPEALP